MDEKTLKAHAEDVSGKLATRVSDAIDKKVDAALERIVASHRSALFVAVIVIVAAVLGATLLG